MKDEFGAVVGGDRRGSVHRPLKPGSCEDEDGRRPGGHRPWSRSLDRFALGFSDATLKQRKGQPLFPYGRGPCADGNEVGTECRVSHPGSGAVSYHEGEVNVLTGAP